jgi:peptide/nickel transport system permease protein
MLAYTIRRLASAEVLLFVMSIVTFAIFYASPTDPARLACGKNCTPSQLEQTRKAYGYDKPITTQFGRFMKGLAVGRDYPEDAALRTSAPELITHCGAPCLGYSPGKTALVLDLIKERLPISVFVALFAFVLWIVFGISGGLVAALFRGRWPDRTLVGLSLVGYSFPTFFIGLTLYNYVALKWQLVPIPEYISPLSDPIGFLRGSILPAVTLALIQIAAYIRLTRAYVLEAMSEDYLRTARAKGLTERRVVLKHTLRAALTPITTIAGLDLGILLAGAAITETIFGFNGVGKLAVESAVNQDLPTNVGIVLVAATFILLANILVDVLYAYIDPRVRYA